MSSGAGRIRLIFGQPSSLASDPRTSGLSVRPGQPTMMPMDHKLPIQQAKSDGTIASVLLKVEPAPSVSSLYLHIPFCFHKCHYCDFYSLANTNHEDFVGFVARMGQELEAAGRYLSRPLDTLYIGGGTPTLLGPDLWRSLIRHIHSHVHLAPDTEWTVEANPETVTPDLMAVLAAGGVNRVSIGCQTFSPTHLKTLERWHEPSSVVAAVESARDAGIENISLDLIYAIPGQTLGQWEDDLSQALALHPQHLSCYALTFEPGTPLAVKLSRGLIDTADADLEADMFTLTRRLLIDSGFCAYEVSNFARAGRESRHNLAYWLNMDWMACGPSASGHVAGIRWKNRASLSEYLHTSTPWPTITDLEMPQPARALAERLMMGLRLARGLPYESLLADAEAIGARVSFVAALGPLIDAEHVIVDQHKHLCLTEQGLLLADSVFRQLMSAVFDPNC